MAMDIGTLVATVKVDDGDFNKKVDGWSTKGAGIASAFGNVAADAISQTVNVLSSYVGEAVAASDATFKFQKTLEFAGLGTAKIDALTKATKAYADSTVYNLGDIQSITASLASNGVKDYGSLAEALGNLNAVAGGSPETYSRLGSMLTQTAGAGKLTTENWNQLTDAISGASGPIQNALLQAGAYTGNFREAMEKGQITAEEFNAAIMLLGTEPIAVEAAKSTETFEGAAGNLSATIQGKLVEALNLVKGPITDFQGGVAWFIQNLEQFTPLLAGLGVALAVVLAPSIWAAVVATAAWTVALLANPMTWIVLAIVALVAAIVWLIQNWDVAVAWISDVWGGFIDWIVGVIDMFVAIWNATWTAVGQFITDVWNGFTSWVKSVWDGFINFVISAILAYYNFWRSIWEGVASFFTGIWNGIVNWAVTFIQAFINTWRGIWNGLTGFFSSLFSGIGNTIRSVWNGIIGFFNSIPTTIRNIFNGAATWLFNIGRDIVQGLWNGLKSIWDSVSRWFSDTFGGIIDLVAGIFDTHSPSRVFHKFGVNIGEGLIEGLDEMEGPVEAGFRRITEVPPITVPTPTGAAAGGAPVTKVMNYYAAEHQSLSTQEALFAALGSPRAAGTTGGFWSDDR